MQVEFFRFGENGSFFTATPEINEVITDIINKGLFPVTQIEILYIARIGQAMISLSYRNLTARPGFFH
jgi:hypothetical protein